MIRFPLFALLLALTFAAEAQPQVLSQVFLDDYPRVSSGGEYWDSLNGSGPDLFIVVTVNGDARYRSGVYQDLPARHRPLMFEVTPNIVFDEGDDVEVYLYDDDSVQSERVASLQVSGRLTPLWGPQPLEGGRGSLWRVTLQY